MIKQFFKDSFIYGSANILSRGIAILLLPLYTRVLSPEEYGVVDMLTIFGALMNLIVSLEISQGFARLYLDASDVSDKIAYSSTALWFTVSTYIVFTMIALFSPEQLIVFLTGSLAWRHTFRVAVFSIAANGVFYLFQLQLRYQLQSRHYALSSITFMVITAIVSAVLVLIEQYGVDGIFYGQIVGAVAGAIVAWFCTRNNYKLLFAFHKCKEMLKFSIPLVLSSINVFIALYIDRIAIKKLMTLNDVGVYGVGYRFASIVHIVMIGFIYALTPLIYKRYSHESTPCDLARIFRYFLVAALPFLIFIALFSKEFVWVFTVPRYYPAWSTIPVIATAILLSNMYIFMPGLDIAKKTRSIAVINIISASSNTVLNFILIPFMGINGAALATLAGSLSMFLLYTFFSQKFYFVPHNWQKIIRATILSLIFIIASFTGSYYFDQYTVTISLLKSILGVSCFCIIVFMLLEVEEIQRVKYYLTARS